MHMHERENAHVEREITDVSLVMFLYTRGSLFLSLSLVLRLFSAPLLLSVPLSLVVFRVLTYPPSFGSMFLFVFLSACARYSLSVVECWTSSSVNCVKMLGVFWLFRHVELFSNIANTAR